jgi:hypothetical protein
VVKISRQQIGAYVSVQFSGTTSLPGDHKATKAVVNLAIAKGGKVRFADLCAECREGPLPAQDAVRCENAVQIFATAANDRKVRTADLEVMPKTVVFECYILL